MNKVYGFNVDALLRDLADLGVTAAKHPFFKDIENICNCEGEKCEEECECTAPATGVLRTDVKKYSDKFVLIAEVPGLSDEYITVEFKDDKLSLVADYKKDNEEEFTRIRQGKWKIIYKFKDVDSEKISAKLDKGQLFITLPKKPEAQPFKVQINK